MALTISQVNQGFLALFGRPATGAEATKFASQADVATLANALLVDPLYTSELTASFPKIKTVDLNAATDDAFVESLYGALIGRASDAEGKTYWLGVKAAGATREEVLAQFEAVLKEQATQGTADGIAYENIMSEDTSLVSAWVESLYQNLAARASDVEGLNYWTTQAIQNGGAAVVAAFAASLAAQGATTEDGQNFAKKQAFADAFTNAFKDFNNLITTNEKALVLGNLHTMMDGVNKDSQEDQYTEEIIKIVNEYQDIKSVNFTKADDDDLGIDPETGESNLTSAANFTGTYNLTDETKGTIQGSDRATGSEQFLSDTLTVSVTGYDKTEHPVFELNNLPTTSSVEKLVINNGAAGVIGNISDDFEYVNIKGTGSFDITATNDLKDVVLNSGSSKEGEYNYFNGSNVTSLKTSAGNDVITLSGEVAKALSTGAGKDYVNANLADKATADLGAGDDTFTGSLGKASSLNAGAGDDILNVTSTSAKLDTKSNPIPEITIDGGTGKDTLNIEGNVYGGVKSIKGVENININSGATLFADAISGQKILLSGAADATLSLVAKTGVDLSKISNADGQSVQIQVYDVKSGNVNLSASNKDFNLIKESVSLDKDASKVGIKGFEKGYDKIDVAGAKVDGALSSTVAADTVYFVGLKEKVTVKDLQTKLGNTGLGQNDVFYIVASAAYDVDGTSSAAKIYKVEVGANGKVGKVDQMATVNVSDRDILDSSDFVNGGTPVPPTPSTEDITKITVDTNGNLDLSKAEPAMTDATKAYSVDLSTNPDFVAGKVKTVSLDGVKAAELTVENKGAASTNPVEVKVPAGAQIEKLTVGSATDNTQYNVTVDKDASVSTIITNNVDNIIDISALPAGTVKVVDGGAGNDTLVISGEAAANIETMNNIEVLKYTGTTISYNAIATNAQELKVQNASDTDSKPLTIIAGNATEINLENLVNDDTASLKAALEIRDIAAGATVKLSKGADAKALAETVVLAGVTGVTVSNVQAGDTIVSDSFKGFTDSFKSSDTLTDKGVFFAAAAKGQDAKAVADELAKTLPTGSAILAVNTATDTTSGSELFIVKDGVATLVVKTDNTISADDKVADGSVSFDGGTPAPEPTSLVFDGIDRYTATVTKDTELTISAEEAGKAKDSAKTIIVTATDAAVSFKDLAAGAANVDTLQLQSTGKVTLNGALAGLSALTTITDTAGNTTVNLNETFTALEKVNLGAGDDTLNLGESFSGDNVVVSAEAGDDTIDISALKVANIGTSLTINGGADNDTVNLGAFADSGSKLAKISDVETIVASGATIDLKAVASDADSGTANAFTLSGDLTVKAGASDATVSTAAVKGTMNDNLTIDLTNVVTLSSVTALTGSANVRDIVVIKDNLSGVAAAKDIDAIEGSGTTSKVKVDVVAAGSTVKAVGGTLELDASAYAGEKIDLTALTALNSEQSTNLTTSGVAKNIALSADAKIADTIALGNMTTGSVAAFTIDGLGVSDKINVKVAFGGSDGAFADYTSKEATSITANKAYRIDDSSKTLAQIAEQAKDFASYFKDSGTKVKGLAFIQGSDGMAVYLAADDDANSLTLLATLNGAKSIVDKAEDIYFG